MVVGDYAIGCKMGGAASYDNAYRSQVEFLDQMAWMERDRYLNMVKQAEMGCPKCGRTKQNHKHKTCDGCGAPK